MPDDNNKLSTTGGNAGNKLATGNKIAIKKPLWQRSNEADKKQEAKRAADEIANLSMENRLCLMLDISGSMSSTDTGSKSKIEYLRDAYHTFISQLDFTNTTLGVETFPYSNEREYEGNYRTCGIRTAPLTDRNALMVMSTKLEPTGCTPMHTAMQHVINNYSLTRGILISDGDADSSFQAEERARDFKEAGVPIDCIHIGSSRGGEQLLQTIAEITGGIYIKFTDVAAFSTSLAYLTPRFRAMLASGQVDAKTIGANEVKFLGGK